MINAFEPVIRILTLVFFIGFGIMLAEVLFYFIGGL